MKLLDKSISLCYFQTQFMVRLQNDTAQIPEESQMDVEMPSAELDELLSKMYLEDAKDIRFELHRYIPVTSQNSR